MGRPKVIINVASSLDGIIGTDEGALSLSTTDDWTRVHALRNSVDAILIGINTAINDDPLLTVRYVETKSPPPYRVILDSRCRINFDSKIVQNQEEFPTIIFTSLQSKEEKRTKLQEMGVKIEIIKEKDEENFLDLSSILSVLEVKYSVSCILVEGGSTIIAQLLKKKLVDILHIFYRFVLLGGQGGKKLFDATLVRDMSDALRFELVETSNLQEGILVTLKPINNLDNK